MSKRPAPPLGDTRYRQKHSRGNGVPGRFGAFRANDITRLRRFLILGAEGGSYYTEQRELALENAVAVRRLITEADRGAEVVKEVLAVSIAGRAAKQSPTLFVLAMASRLGNPETRRLAYAALPKVARTPTMLFEFIGYNEAIDDGTGWGRGLRRAVGEIYNSKSPRALAHWVTKYRNRGGWCHRDVLRLSHVKPGSDGHALVLRYSAKDELAPSDAPAETDATKEARRFLEAVEIARRSTEPSEVVRLIKEHTLAREHVASELLSSADVWAALLEGMPMTAMLRNLAKMTAIGLLKPLSRAVRKVCEKLDSAAQLKAARVHPFSVLLALKTYESGQGVKGKLSWTPVPEIIAALNRAFYASFDHVEPTGKRFVLALDVSGSMGWGNVNGAPSITPRVAAAAMSMAVLKCEPAAHPLAFTDRLMPLSINASMSLDEVMAATDGIPFGATDCAQPMLWALRNRVEADMFVVFTDCETWAGEVTPADALRQYREATGIPARLAVIAMTSGGFTLADPEDSGMLDMCGFDASAPQILRDFALGAYDLNDALERMKV